MREALKALGIEAEEIRLDHPAESMHGDYATNAALVYGKVAKIAPRVLAEKLVEELLRAPSDLVAKIEIAGPGFINFFLTDSALKEALFQSKALDTRKGEKINIEFVSTNPTGELHIGHGRSAFYGDTLARVLALSGAEVTREFYINDSMESNQIKELGKTALGKGEQYKTPELEKKMKVVDFSGLSEDEAGVKLASLVQASNRAFIEQGLGVQFDMWYSEDTELRASGANAKMLALLKEREFTYEKDGALWLKTSEFGDDEDRVIVRSDGTMTYFIADIAYHQNKFDRGFQTVINVWGADHHGHVKRMQAVGRMLGWPKTPITEQDQPVIFIAQLVSLKEDGISKKMSKRAGNVIQLRDLVEEFGIDVVRWFFNEKALNTQMNFDMALAREQSEKNPVYYVQYSHARLSSILEKTRALSEIREGLTFTGLMQIASARALVMKINEFPEVVADTARDYGVQALTNYATALASAVSAYYRDVRIINDNGYDAGALTLLIEAKKTLAQTLSILGISAPEKM